MNNHKFQGPPADDDGVKNEQVVEICEYVITNGYQNIFRIEYGKHLEEEEFMRQMHMEQHEDEDGSMT